MPSWKVGMSLTLLTVVFIMCACAPQPSNDTSDPEPYKETEPENVPTETVINPSRSLYHPQVAEVMSGNRSGLMAVRLWEDAQPSDVIYLFDPAGGSHQPLIIPTAAAEVFQVAINDDWVAWVERADDTWRLLLQPLPGGEPLVITSGHYNAVTGPDFPTPVLNDRYLAYNVSYPTEDTMDSFIIVRKLSTGDETILDSITCDQTYVGPPSLCGNIVAWHRGEWTEDMVGSVFIHDLSQQMTWQLPTADHNEAHITPAVCGDWIVWVQYHTQHPETKNIMYSRLSEHDPQYLTKAVTGNRQEFHSPSIGFGVTTWNENLPSDSVPYQLLQYDRLMEGVPAAGPQLSFIHGSYLTWRQDGHQGVFFRPLVLSGPGLDLSSEPDEQLVVPTQVHIPVNQFGDLSPLEMITVYAAAVNSEELAVLDIICEPDLRDAFAEYGIDHRIAAISPRYLRCGETAYVAVKIAGNDHWSNLRMERHGSMWMIPFLAGQ